MAKSDLLRFQDARDAYRLIGECRDLGSDPALWHGQMFAGLCQLIGVPMVTGGEGQWLRPHDTVKAVSAFQAGFDAHAFELYMAYMRKITPGRPSLSCAPAHPRPARDPHAAAAGARHRVVSVCHLGRLSSAVEDRRHAGVG